MYVNIRPIATKYEVRLGMNFSPLINYNKHFKIVKSTNKRYKGSVLKNGR